MRLAQQEGAVAAADMMATSSLMSPSPASASSSPSKAFFDTLSNAQREQLAAMSSMTDKELSAFGKDLVSASVEHCKPGPSSKFRKLEKEEGTGDALAAFLKRAVDFKYITQAEHDRILARISAIAAAQEREMATVAAMRRFIANTQPLGGNMVLVGCPVRHKDRPDFDLNGVLVRTEGLPGGTPERYNVQVAVKERKKGKVVRGFKPGEDDDDADAWLVVQVEPRYMRPVPIACDFSDEYHEKIPEDHMAEAWYAAEEARYAKNEKLTMLMALGGRGPARPE